MSLLTSGCMQEECADPGSSLAMNRPSKGLLRSLEASGVCPNGKGCCASRRRLPDEGWRPHDHNHSRAVKQTPCWSPLLVPSPAMVPHAGGSRPWYGGSESLAPASSPALDWRGLPPSASFLFCGSDGAHAGLQEPRPEPLLTLSKWPGLSEADVLLWPRSDGAHPSLGDLGSHVLSPHGVTWPDEVVRSR